MPSIALPVSLRGQLLSGTRTFSPSALFAANEPGVWYDPSDVANLAWRRNLLTYSEQFDNSVWLFARGTKGAAQTDPNGGMTAIRFTATSANADIYQSYVGANVAYVGSIYVRRVSGSGVVEMFPPSLAGGTAIALTSDWQRFSRTSLPSSGTTAYMGVRMLTSGDVIDVAFGQLEFGTSATDYQRISDVNTEVIERFPNATLYQDPAGTTAVTTPGQTVGLMLDKSKGLALGAETVANPGNPFVSTTGYSAGGSATISVDTGRLKVAQTTGFTDGVLCALPNNTFAKSTVISFDVDLGSASLVQVQAGNGAFGNGGVITVNITASGTYSIRTTTLSSGVNGLTFKAGSAANFFLSRVSVRELPGNHATQATLASRPIYGIEPVGGRRNLLLQTENFAPIDWTKTSLTVSGNQVSYVGGLGGTKECVQLVTVPGGTANKTLTAYVTVSGSGTFRLKNTHSGVLDNFSANVTATGTRQTIALTVTNSASAGNGLQAISIINSTGDAAFSLTVHEFQLELSATATAYQRVTTQYDVTEAGVASTSYLAFDGVDDGMVTGTITPGVDKAQVFAGVRKLSDAAQGLLIESSSTSATTAGTVGLHAPRTISNRYGFNSQGTILASVTTSSAAYDAPNSSVVSGLADISGDSAIMRINGTQLTPTTTDQGTGNFLAYPLYIGRRGGASLPFKGNVYTLITRFGANLDAGVITNTETWVAGKTGISL
jgi:hypothetical protein